MELNLDDIVDHLRKMKTDHGEVAMKEAASALIKDLFVQHGDQMNTFVESLAEGVAMTGDLKKLREEAAERVKVREKARGNHDPNQLMLQAIQQQMPNLTTQAHFDVLISGWEALREYMDAAFGQDLAKATAARKALSTVLDLAPKVGALADKVKEDPNAVSDTAYSHPPKEFGEVKAVDSLLLELDGITTSEDLVAWYSESRGARDAVISQSQRDRLFDAVRAKKKSLAG